jgi:ankyrin repeat protein
MFFLLIWSLSCILSVCCAMDNRSFTKDNAKIEQDKLTAMLYKALEDESCEAVTELIKRGANVNALTTDTNYRSRSPLMFALLQNNGIQKATILLDAGANPNIWGFGHPEKTIIDSLFPLWWNSPRGKNEMQTKLLMLYGGKSTLKYGNHGYSDFQEALNKIFPQQLLKAIAMNDEGVVDIYLKFVGRDGAIKDEHRVSALAYAAGQANKEILTRLLAHAPYQYDTSGLEHALRIVISRLRGLEPKSSESEQYNGIYSYLQNEWYLTRHALEQYLNKFGRAAGLNPLTGVTDVPNLPELPPELIKHILEFTMSCPSRS